MRRQLATRVSAPFPFAHTLLINLVVPHLTVNARRLGIGRRLMERLIVEAQSMGIREIWGSVTDGDASASPFLLDWYRGFGFTVTPADKECIPESKWKISLMLTAGCRRPSSL